MWSVQGPEPDEDEDSDDDMEDLGDGIEVPKRNVEKLRAAWWYLDCPGKSGLPAGAGQLSALQVSKCWYAQRESPTFIRLKRPSTGFGSSTTALRAVAESLETSIEVSEPLLSDTDSDDSANSYDYGFSSANMACDEEFVQDWSGGPESAQSEVSSTHSSEIVECAASDSGHNEFEDLDIPAASEFCMRMVNLQQRISTLTEDKLALLQQARAVSLESDKLEAECQDLRSKLKAVGESAQFQQEDANTAGSNLVLRSKQLQVAGELELRQLGKLEQHERRDLLAKAAGMILCAEMTQLMAHSPSLPRRC